MSHIFRAFFAPMANRAAPLATSGGQVTQAVYIFTNMLRKLLQDEKPNYIAAIFESKEKTFRHETFAGYKANRLAMPEDLASQLPYIFRLCEAFNIPVINAPGFEADDVIGTLEENRRPETPGCDCVERQRHVPAGCRPLCRLHAYQFSSREAQGVCAADRVLRRSLGRKEVRSARQQSG